VAATTETAALVTAGASMERGFCTIGVPVGAAIGAAVGEVGGVGDLVATLMSKITICAPSTLNVAIPLICDSSAFVSIFGCCIVEGNRRN
jgi:hypothetical protein